jgi:hypothetical protein
MQTMTDEAKTNTPNTKRFYRVAWEFGGFKGHDSWQDDDEFLKPWVRHMNVNYGEGSHVIESTDGLDALEEAEAMISRAKQSARRPAP